MWARIWFSQIRPTVRRITRAGDWDTLVDTLAGFHLNMTSTLAEPLEASLAVAERELGASVDLEGKGEKFRRAIDASMNNPFWEQGSNQGGCSNQ